MRALRSPRYGAGDYVGSGLPQFPQGPRQSHLGFSLELARWVAPRFGATVLGLAVKLDGPVL